MPSPLLERISHTNALRGTSATQGVHLKQRRGIALFFAFLEVWPGGYAGIWAPNIATVLGPEARWEAMTG